MTTFGALDAATSGASLARTWLDAVSDNVANLGTVRRTDEQPYRSRQVVAATRADTGGVAVAGVVERGGPPEIVYDPENPLADERGYVVRPSVDLGEEMTSLLMASRLYQANLQVMSAARDAYSAALQIGVR